MFLHNNLLMLTFEGAHSVDLCRFDYKRDSVVI